MQKSAFSFLAIAFLTLAGCTAPQQPTEQEPSQEEKMVIEEQKKMDREVEAMLDEQDKMMLEEDMQLEQEEVKMEDEAFQREDEELKSEDEKAMEEDDTDDDLMMEDDLKEESTSAVKEEGKFLAYSDGVIGNGKESVLFFHAQWCPYCRANEDKLHQWYPSDDYINIYKIDYDTAGDLKARFGVVQQDTFVRIDGTGVIVDDISFPSESHLMAIIAR